MKLRRILAILFTVTSALVHAAVPIKDVLGAVDPATGKPKDTTREYSITGVVAARLVIADDKVLAFVINPGEPALPVLTTVADAALLIPRYEVNLAGKLGDGPLGAALVMKPGSVSVTATNKAFGLSEPRGTAFFKDPSSLAGRYVQLTNVTLSVPKFAADSPVVAKGADGTQAPLLVGKGVAGHEAPGEAVNVFGIPVKVGGEWKLVTARILLARGKDLQNVAIKRTCFTCHNPDMRAVGPAYRDVAARYRNDPEAVWKLTIQMKNGGGGKWGIVPMPPFGAVVPAVEMKGLAEWIMSYRWDALLAE